MPDKLPVLTRPAIQSLKEQHESQGGAIAFDIWLTRQFARFMSDIRFRIDAEFDAPVADIDGIPHISALQVARALRTGEWHVTNWRYRERLKGTQFGRRSVFSRASIDALLASDTEGGAGPRYALLKPFLEWVDENTRKAARGAA